MIRVASHEAEVGRRFDALQARFRIDLRADDARLAAVVDHLGDSPRRGPILDLGCGKGRFAARLESMGATVVGLDRSAAMLGRSIAGARVLGSARRLPFADRSFAGALAVEVFEHLAARSRLPCLRELRRVLRPGGRLVIVDKSAVALDRTRPWLPALVVKRIDEHRGRWMYPRDSPVRERWFWPGQIQRLMREAGFVEGVGRPIRFEDERHRLFQLCPSAGRFRAWSATVPGEPDG